MCKAAGAVLIPVLLLGGGEPAAELESFDWLVGTWERESSRGQVYETWRRASERTLEGESHFVSKSTGQRRLGESLLLVEMGGRIFYIPRPMENDYPVAFRLSTLRDGRAVFENPDHDFPTRIIYTRHDQDSMTVTIAGPGGDGETRSIDFHFTRAGPDRPARRE